MKLRLLLTAACMAASVLSAGLLSGLPAAAAMPASGSAAHPSDTEAFRAETLAKLQALLRVESVNPPGNESPAAELLRGWLAAEGIESVIVGPSPDRGSLVARLRGNGQEPPLMLLSHLDVVPAEEGKWKYPPFGAVVKDGVVWGRGTVDTKGLTVMQLMALLDLKRRHVPLRRDVILCAVADEEGGGEQGAAWLKKNRPDLVDANEILNEGGGGLIFPNGRRLIGINAAERGGLWVRITAHGRPSHGSYERVDGATRRLVRALYRLETAPRPFRLVPEMRSLIKVLGPTIGGFPGWVVSNLDFPGAIDLLGPRLVEIEPTLATWFGWSMNTTVLAAGNKVNVMPGEASAEVDIRLLPGDTPDDALAYLRHALGDPGLDLKIISSKMPSRSEPSGPAFEAVRAALRAEYPDAGVSAMLAPTGGTDCAIFRDEKTRCFGVWPIVMTLDQFKSVHGHDEFLTLEQLASGTRVMLRTLEAAAAL